MHVLARPILRVTAVGSLAVSLAFAAVLAGGARTAPEAPPEVVTPTSGPPAKAAAAPALRFTGLTYAGSRGGSQALVLRSTRGVFHPDTDLASPICPHRNPSESCNADKERSLLL